MAKIKIKSILKSPFTIIIGMVLGITTGLIFKDFSLHLVPFGDAYLLLLKMTIFPILMLAVITSVGKLFTSANTQKFILRIVLISLLLLALTSVLTIVVSEIIRPGYGLSKEAQVKLGQTLNEADQSGGVNIKVNQDFFSFIKQLIPENIFDSMGRGASLELLFFSILLGIAIGLIKKEQSQFVLNLTESLFQALFLIIIWIMYLLPFGLFCLLAGQIASTGLDTFKSMAKFVAVIYIICFILIAASFFVICLRKKVSLFSALSEMKEAMLISFGTQSTFASMPAMIEGLTGNKIHVNKEVANLVVPLGAVINRFSMIILYAAAAIFAAQLYHIELGWNGILITFLLSIAAAIAGAGTPGIVSIAMISIVFFPLGLPSSAIIILLLAINPVIEPFTTMSNVVANTAAVTLIDKNT